MKKVIYFLALSLFCINAIAQTSLNVVSPATGDNWAAGSNQNIAWITQGNVQYVDIYYSTDGGSTYNLISDFTANNGVQDWVVPAQISSTNCKVAVFNSLDNNIFSESGKFTISTTAGSLAITSPNGGEYLTGGATYSITWTQNGLDSAKLYYSINGGSSWNYISNVSASALSYSWTVPYVNSSNCLVKIVDAADTSMHDASNNYFNISGSYLTVTSPNGGENLTGNSSYSITWSYAGGGSYINLYYSRDNGQTWTSIVNGTSKSSGSYAWTVPNVSGNQYKIKIEDYSTTAINDVSDNVFSVTGAPATLYLTYPNGGQMFKPNQSVGVTWNSSGISKVNLYYTSNNGTNWSLIEGNVTANEGNNTYYWTTPQATSNQYRIKIANSSDTLQSKTSTNTFSIQNPSVTITTPNGGEVWAGASSKTIYWNSFNLSSYVNIYYSTDGGATYTSIVNGTNNNGYYNWTVANIATTQARIKVVDYYDNTISDISDTNFTITAPVAAITINYPAGGEQWTVGTSQTITWSSSGVTYINIEYSTDGGNSYTSYVNGTSASSGQYSFTVPNVVSNNCKIRLSDYYNSNINAVSGTLSFVKPTITVITPNGGESYAGASSQTAYFYNNGGYAYVNVAFSSNNGNTWTTLLTNAYISGGNASVSWTVPNIASTNCKIKVTNYNDSTIADISDAVFTVNYTTPSIVVTSPNGGETYAEGQSYSVQWTAYNVANSNLYYSSDSGSTWTLIASNQTTYSGSNNYYWTVPSGINSKKCLIKVEDASNASYNDKSNGVFSILAPSITVTTPNGGEYLQVGTNYAIKWTSVGISSYVTIEYKTSPAGNWTTIVAGVSSSGSYNWSVPSPTSGTCKIRVSDYYNSSYSDVSDFNFSIVNAQSASISVYTPSTGSKFQINSSQYIQWNSTNVSNVKIEYNLNGNIPTGWVTVTNSVQNSNSYNWTVPGTPSATARVRVSDASNSSVSSVSDNFEIINPYINVTAPTASNTWTAGTSQYINWDYSGVSSYVAIYYSTDGGSTWTLIVNGTNNYGYYAWSIPSQLGGKCVLVKVADYYYPNTIYGVSASCANIDQATPTITVTTPNGGESYTAASQTYVYWSYSNVDSVKIEFTNNNGASWSTVVNSTPASTGYYYWTVPNSASKFCKIKISSVANAAITDMSNSVFQITKPSVTIIAPNGGENFDPASIASVRWTSQSISSNYAYLYYSVDGGSSWNYITGAYSYDNTINTYNWTVPNNPSTNCLFKITDYNNASYFDTSDARFTINQPTPAVTVNYPNGGESLTASTSTTITYTSQSITNVKIEYTTDNGSTWQTIVASTSATGSYAWQVPSVSTTTARIRISDASNSQVSDMSNGNFSITIPRIEVVSPNGGETYTTSTTATAKYYVEGIANGYVRLYYSVDSGATWTYYYYASVSNNQLNTSNWSTPSTPTTKAYIKIADYYNTSIYDTSDYDFNIVNPQPSITVTSPNGGEVWGIGSYYYITWNNVSVNSVNIYYSIDNGSTWNSIASSQTGSSYYWNVPASLTNAPYNNCRVKVEDASNSSLFDISNATFTLTQPGITVNTPNGGEVYTATNYAVVRWTPVAANNYVNIYYSLDSGVTYNYITQVYSTNGIVNSYSWYINNGLETDKAFIKVCDYNNTNLCDASDAKFKIGPSTPYVSVSYPNGGETFTAGQSYNIRWTSNNVGYVKIEYSLNNGSSYSTIIASVASTSGVTNNYNWAVPTNISPSCQVLVKITDVTDAANTDVSNSTFCIGVPTVTVVAPNGGETWQGGTQQQIKWTSTNISSYVYISLSTDGGNTYGTPFFASNTGTYNYTVPNTPTTTARIRVADYYNQNIKDESNANFTITQATPTITVTAPNGGEEYVVGQNYNIQWSSVSVNEVSIQYSTDNGSTWQSVANNLTASTGYYAWTTPNTPSNQCLIKVYSTSNNSLYDVSNSNFTIRSPYIVVNAPNGGETWGIGSNRYITWSSAGVSQVNIYYSTNAGATWGQITSNYQAGTGYYNWAVPNTPATTCRVKVVSSTDSTNFDISDNNFTIPNPGITITSPNGGEVWSSGSQRTIYWSSTGIQSVLLEYSTDSGSTWNTIISSTTASNGYYNWNIPNVTSNKCLVRATDISNNAYTDVSNSVFSIIAPTLAITYPNGGETFVASTNQTIRWTSNGVSSYVKLEYSINSGSTWNVITSAASNTGSYVWSVPNTPSTDCKVRVTDYYVTSVSAVSNGTFTIKSPQPTIVVNSPNGGESWTIGSLHNIAWSSVSVANVKIEYTTNTGTSWNTIIASTPSSNGNNYYQWSIPNVASTKCKVRISDVSNSNIMDESDALFTIPNPVLTIISPNGGEVWGSPSSRYIYWNAVSVPTVKIEYTTNGSLWNTIVSSTSGTTGSYLWSVPSGINSTNCKVRITSTTNSISTQSAAKFTIQQPTLTVLNPNGGETFAGLSYKTITWSGVATSGYVKIEYTTNNGTTWTTVLNGASNSGSYNWYVPNTPSTLCKVRVSDYYDNSITDVSNATFTITQANPVLTLTSPNGGENWLAGNYNYIYWNASSVQNVKLEYSINNGTTWTTIASSVSASAGYYYWYIPNTPSNQCLVKVSDAANAQLSDVSNAVFSINQPVPAIKVTSPNGGESYAVGAYTYIYWNATAIPTVDLYLSTNGGSTYNTIATNVSASQGYYYVQVPNFASTHCLIKVASSAYGIADESDNEFTIYTPQVNNNSLATNYTGKTALCKGDSIYVAYVATGSYSNTNYFSVQLSDTSGSFSSPTQIGYKQTNNLNDSILAYIPSYAKNGLHYKVRVVSNDLPAVGTPSSQSLKIGSPEFSIAADDYIKYLPDGKVNFTYVAASDTAGLSYKWSFGDGTTSTQMNPLHNYNAHGSYTVTVKATDNAGCKVEQTFPAYIRVEQVFPTITIPPANNNNLNAVSMVNAYVGCAVGNSGTVLLTNNGGVSWTPVQANVSGNINSVYMYNVNVGIIVTSTGFIYQTLDGGLTWTQISSANSNALYSVAFKDSADAYIVGQNGTIITLTGNPQTGYAAGNAVNPINANCNAVSFAVTTPYCVASNGKIYQKNGSNWSNAVYSGANISLNAIAFNGSNIGFAVGEAGTIVRYQNGAWTKVFDGLSTSFTGIQLKDSLTAYAVGEDGTVYITINGGTNWDRYSIGNTTNLRAASYKSGKGVIVGNQGGGFRFGGSDISFALADSALCAGEELSIDYHVAGGFNANNIFKAELSDANGDFTTPTLLGYVSSTTYGTINATVPANTPTGNKYRVRISSTDSAVVSSDNGKDIVIRQSPTPILGADTSICSGSTLTLNSGIANAQYSWSTGATTATVSVNATNGYWVVVTDPATGCYGKDSVHVEVIGTLAVNLGSDISTCSSSNIELDAGVAGAAYSWSTGATTQAISVTTSGNYWVAVTKCSQTAYDTIKIDLSQSMANVTVSAAGGMLTAGGVYGAGISYQWYSGSNPGYGTLVQGATSQSYSPIATGWYYVMATNTAGCSNYSAAIYFSSIGFAEYLSNASVFGLYPNPAINNINFKLVCKEKNVQITVYDIVGKEVKEHSFSINAGLLEGTIDISELPNGVYLVKAKTEGATYQQRIIVKR